MPDSTQSAARLPCLGCGADTASDALGEYYMVTDEVWALGGAGRGFLCIGCLEARIGRRLTAADFTGAPCNWLPLFPKSDRILDRMGMFDWVDVS